MRDSSAVERNKQQSTPVQSPSMRPALLPANLSRKMIIGGIMGIALLAFELFNFDTTRYALRSLLGDVRFLGLYWAGILAIAFCAIDFAGLARLFTPQKGDEEPTAVYYLMGAWLLGATMNAVMTWWAVSLTLLTHELGNEILSREQLLHYVPLFVATLVWLTRILFIGAFSVAGEHVFDLAGRQSVARQGTVKTRPAERGNGRYPQKTERPSMPNRPSRRSPMPMQARRRR